MALHVIDFASKKNLPLYIKPHPTRYTYTSEQKFNSSIAKSLDEKKRANPNFYFELINGELNNCDLLKFKNLIAITGRGTVSIECGFLGIPIITMYDSFNNFSFTTNFSNYKSLDLAIEKINDNYNKKIQE